MAPTLHCVRHAQGFHNLDPRNEQTLLDPDLTARGRDQCKRLAAAFPYHDEIELVIASPLRRTIQTALLGFGPTIASTNSQLLLEPRCQETTAGAADTGSDRERLVQEFGGVLDFSRWDDRWNLNQGEWEMTDENLEKHCTELRDFIMNLPLKNVVLVAHGSFLEHFTRHGGWHNTEFRSYDFIHGAELAETALSEKLREENPQGGYRKYLGEPNENPFGLEP